MNLHIDVPWILQVAEAAGADDPAPDDYGVPVSAVARHRAELFEQPVYDGPYAKAAALVHTLGRCRWLERSNLAVAAATGVMYLEAAGHHRQADPRERPGPQGPPPGPVLHRRKDRRPAPDLAHRNLIRPGGRPHSPSDRRLGPAGRVRSRW